MTQPEARAPGSSYADRGDRRRSAAAEIGDEQRSAAAELCVDAGRCPNDPADLAKPAQPSHATSETAPGEVRPPEPPVLPDVTRNEVDDSWGESADDRDEWYLRERPPHHE